MPLFHKLFQVIFLKRKAIQAYDLQIRQDQYKKEEKLWIYFTY
jgi:hypothetical protein